MNKLTRRQFLKLGGAAAGAILAGGCTSKLITPTPIPTNAPTQSTMPTATTIPTKHIVPTATSALTSIPEKNIAPATGEYFGQTPPGDTAVLFAPEVISLANRKEFKIAFSPDGKECYFDTDAGMYTTQCINNIWTEQKQAPFSVGKNAGEPAFSADGKRLYFTCWNYDIPESDIWYVERIADGWGEPQILSLPVDSNTLDYSYTESADGVGYFTSNRPWEGSSSVDLWRLRRSPNLTYQVENLGSIVNSSTEDFSPCIAPDGSYLIFASYRASRYSEQSLWISFNKGNDEWTAPVDMEESGAGINIRMYWQISPSLSPDGKYLFFCHHAAARDSIHLYWVSTHIIEGLKKIAFAA